MIDIGEAMKDISTNYRCAGMAPKAGAPGFRPPAPPAPERITKEQYKQGIV